MTTWQGDEVVHKQPISIQITYNIIIYRGA